MRLWAINRQEKGFTLLEILLSVAIIAILAGIGAPVYLSFQNRNLLDTTTLSYVSSLRRAQLNARSQLGDSAWGVNVQSGSITLFKGTSYAARDTAYDEISTLPTNFAVSGTPETVFAKFSGLPQSTGSLTLTNTNNETRSISVNAKGMVQY